MSGFIDKKEITKSLKEASIVTGAVFASFYVARAVFKIQPPKASLDATDVAKLGGGIVLGTLAKDYAEYKKWV